MFCADLSEVMCARRSCLAFAMTCEIHFVSHRNWHKSCVTMWMRKGDKMIKKKKKSSSKRRVAMVFLFVNCHIGMGIYPHMNVLSNYNISTESNTLCRIDTDSSHPSSQSTRNRLLSSYSRVQILAWVCTKSMYRSHKHKLHRWFSQ